MNRKCFSGLPPVLVGCWALVLAAGCSDSSPSPSPQETATADAKQPPADRTLPETSIPSSREADETDESASQPQGPEKGSAPWLVQEILRVRKKSFDAEAGSPKFKKARQRREERIVELATEAIAKTHADPEQEQLFRLAVQHLMQSRLQLALEGQTEHIDALYADADALYERNPGSPAAAEAAFVCARFAHTNARRFGDREPRWLKEFARQAADFAEKFPEEKSRSATLLHAAGWSCELHGLLEEAIPCYEQLRTDFPNTPQGQQATAVLRRLRLKGQPLQLGGPTVNGEFVSIDDFAGCVVLVVFWASDNSRFQEQLPELTAAIDALPEEEFAVLGVNLDEEETALVEFQQEHDLTWPQIFFPDPEKRRWDNPIVRYYGIRNIPMLWLVDAQGIVAETRLSPDALQSRARPLLNAPANAAE